MACPYAERRGAVIYCRAARKIVNPLTHPCLSKSRYKRCKYYKMAEEKREEPKPREAAPQPERPPEATPREEPARPAPAREEAPREVPARSPLRTRGLTLDGRPARNCLECIYYGKKTGICLLLGVEVRDPNNPPCAEA